MPLDAYTGLVATRGLQMTETQANGGSSDPTDVAGPLGTPHPSAGGGVPTDTAGPL